MCRYDRKEADEEICTAIPTNIAQGVEFVSDARDCCCENSAVLFPGSAMSLLALEGELTKATRKTAMKRAVRIRARALAVG
jgi:hypothetical protein